MPRLSSSYPGKGKIFWSLQHFKKSYYSKAKRWSLANDSPSDCNPLVTVQRTKKGSSRKYSKFGFSPWGQHAAWSRLGCCNDTVWSRELVNWPSKSKATQLWSVGRALDVVSGTISLWFHQFHMQLTKSCLWETCQLLEEEKTDQLF